MAVPMTVKIPDPMTAPIPSAVSDHGPRDFFSAFSGSSYSEISLSIDLQEMSWLRRLVLPFWSDSGPGTAARAMRGKPLETRGQGSVISGQSTVLRSGLQEQPEPKDPRGDSSEWRLG